MGKLFGAVLVSSIDHGVTPPSTLAARNVATTGAPLRAAVAAGVLGLRHATTAATSRRACASSTTGWRGSATARASPTPRTRCCGRCLDCRTDACRASATGSTRSDPRASRLLQMAHELELDGEHVQMMRAIERRLAATRPTAGRCR